MRHTFLLPATAAIGVLMCLSPSARGQVGFMNSTGTAFDPEISVVQSGVVNDVQATVTADRKYVTLTMRTTQSTLIALRDFTFQTSNSTPAGSGFVGMPTQPGGTGNIAGGATNGGTNANGNAANNARAQAQRATPAAAPSPQPTVLDREGMTRIELANPTRQGRLPQASKRSPAR